MLIVGYLHQQIVELTLCSLAQRLPGPRVKCARGRIRRVDGRGGDDKLMLASALTTLDLTTIDNLRYQNIERIDLGTANGGKTLNLTARDVLDLSHTSNKLFVTGNSADHVTAPGPLWSAAGSVIDHGTTYDHYRMAGSAAELLVQHGIDITGLVT